MTLPWGGYSFERALTGIKAAGFRYVAWGVDHRDRNGRRVPVLHVDAPAAQARKLADDCRSNALEPVMMFATVHLEAPEAERAHLQRIEQAAAAKIPYLLTFGKTERGQREAVVRVLQRTARAAETSGVTIVVKQHGGNTATGADCAKLIADVGHEAVKICYDAGNVLDYENHDPIPDIAACHPHVRAFALKDHRNTPKDEDCAPGFGEIDHYKLLAPVMATGRTVPLAFENIFEPLVPRPRTPEGIDTLARRSREYIESVLRGLRIAAGQQEDL